MAWKKHAFYHKVVIIIGKIFQLSQKFDVICDEVVWEVRELLKRSIPFQKQWGRKRDGDIDEG